MLPPGSLLTPELAGGVHAFDHHNDVLSAGNETCTRHVFPIALGAFANNPH